MLHMPSKMISRPAFQRAPESAKLLQQTTRGADGTKTFSALRPLAAEIRTGRLGRGREEKFPWNLIAPERQVYAAGARGHNENHWARK